MQRLVEKSFEGREDWQEKGNCESIIFENRNGIYQRNAVVQFEIWRPLIVLISKIFPFIFNFFGKLIFFDHIQYTFLSLWVYCFYFQVLIFQPSLFLPISIYLFVYMGLQLSHTPTIVSSCYFTSLFPGPISCSRIILYISCPILEQSFLHGALFPFTRAWYWKPKSQYLGVLIAMVLFTEFGGFWF